MMETKKKKTFIQKYEVGESQAQHTTHTSKERWLLLLKLKIK